MGACDAESTAPSTMPGDGVATPTTVGDCTSIIQEWLHSSGLPRSSRVARASDPYVGNTVLIIDKERNRALACHEGNLRLEKVGDLDSLDSVPVHWQWFCTETDGFKGFRSVANGGFLGHDIWWNFYAKVHHHLGWEHATLSRREGGYYWIQFEYWWKLRQLCARGDGNGVYWQKDGGTLWEFAEVDGARD
uniref:Uncharacterized protein n=1 Tax=Bionectria ochroleuca TaxID=29856 RepID=A0A8H7K6B7_BIOOC